MGKKEDHRLIGKNVVVRSNRSGVWHGELVSVSRGKGREGADVVLKMARRAWSWKGALTCAGLAVDGPASGKIDKATPSTDVDGCCEINETTAAADRKWSEVEPWAE